MAGRASVELHTLIFFRGKVVVTEARVIRVRENGLILFVPKFGIEAPVYFASDGAKADASADWELDEQGMSVRSKDGGQTYRMFDRCAVRITVERHGVASREKLVMKLESLEALVAVTE